MTAEPGVRSPTSPIRWGEQVLLHGWASAVLRFVRRKPLGAFGGAVTLLLVVIAIFAGFIAPYSALEHSNETLKGPSAAHWLGTDQFGRDVLSRIIHGARISLYVGVAVTLLGTIPAVLLGLASAYFGGWIDYLVQRLVDTFQSVPYLIMLIAIMVVLGASLTNVVIALSLRRAVVESRVMRAAAMSILNNTYVEAAHATGATDLRIMFRHMIPNIMPTLIVLGSIGFAGVILAEASLSFLGYGVPPPTPSWGGMLAADGRAYMFAAPWMLIAPTIALSITVFGVNMFGDALRDVLDPRLRGSQ
ncbi:MAG: ABC transporter permease subunit [Dehalococcoidia bacterium]|nr:ABC transporter permease subunit [Dehalococcoidia bacterium]